MNPDKISMEVNIAGEHIMLSVPFSRQDAVRKTEADLARLYRIWKEQYPGKSPKELLAMMAYQYASHYHDLLAERDAACEDAEDLLEELRTLTGDDVCRNDNIL